MKVHEIIIEKWSTKYKRSINCNNPQGFSQKAHCAGRKKNEDVVENSMDDMSWPVIKKNKAGEKYVITLDNKDGELLVYHDNGKYMKLSPRNLKYVKQELGILENFADGKVKGKSRPGRVKKSGLEENVTESMDNPYPYSWDVQSEDEWEARARTESGAILEIRFEYGDWDKEWIIDFTLGGRYKATGAGDQFRIFATVVKAIKEWWKSTSAEGIPVHTIKFSADKVNDQTGKSGSREKLYNRFAKQFANSIGFIVKSRDGFDTTEFELINPNYNESTNENFADGKVKGKSRPGRVKRAGASCNGSVTDLRKRAKNSSGEKARMYHWCANMKSGRKKN